jgi:hypothetical protein
MLGRYLATSVRRPNSQDNKQQEHCRKENSKHASKRQVPAGIYKQGSK